MVKTVVYVKQSGEPPVPVTARLEWLPDGKIKPLLFWTPGGNCYGVRHEYEMTPLAYLKDRGEGIRYKIEAELIETPEPDPEKLYARETYLYFADNWFCGKTFVDERYRHAGKEFITVTLDVFPGGDYELVYFKVKETRYMVEKTLKIEPHASIKAGGAGIRHRVEARIVDAFDDNSPNQDDAVIRTSALYFEVNKWFVLMKQT